MATQTATNDREALESLLPARRLMAWGLLWAFVLLLILALWLGATDLEPAILFWGPVFLLAVGALAASVWQWVPARPAGTPDAEVIATVRQQRRQLGFLLLGAAALLLFLGVVVGLQLGLAGFGEASSMVVMALIAAGAAVSQLLPVDVRGDRDKTLEVLCRIFGQVFLWLGVAGVALAVIVFRLLWRGATWIPIEVIGLAVFAIVCWIVRQFMAPSGGPASWEPRTRRRYVLFVGGAMGLTIAVVAGLRIWFWWGEIFTGEGPITQSPGLWRLWLCLYVELLGLALLFGSLLLGRGDVRESAAARRVLYGYNTVLTGLLVLLILVILNVFVYVTYPLSHKWTKEGGLESLSSLTTNQLAGLKDELRAYVLMGQGDRAYAELRSVLDNCQAYTRRLQVEYVSPDRDRGRYLRLAEKFPVILRDVQVQHFEDEESETGRGVLLVYGPEEVGNPPHAFIPVKDLIEVDRDRQDPRKRTFVFKGEKALMTQVRILAEHEKKPTVYFTQGNGELDITDAASGVSPEDWRGGDGLLMDRLKKDNYEVRGLLWREPPARKVPGGDVMAYSKKTAKDKQHEIPEDASVVVIAQPWRPFTDEVLDALDRFMKRPGDKAGRLIVLSNWFIGGPYGFADTRLEEFLQKYNVQLQKDFLVRIVEDRRRQSPFELLARPPAGSRNKVAAAFSSSAFPVGGGLSTDPRGGIGMARSVKPFATPGSYDVEPLLQLTPARNGTFWGETDRNVLRDPYRWLDGLTEDQQDAKKAREAVSVAVAVKDRDGKPRMVVFGDARFTANRAIVSNVPYYDFLTSSMEWLAERPANIGIEPRKSSSYVVDAKVLGENKERLIWLPLGLILLTIIGMGLGVWVVRRR